MCDIKSRAVKLSQRKLLSGLFGSINQLHFLVLTLLEVSCKEDGVAALHLPIGLLKTRSELDPVLRYEPSTYQQ